jgi:hypothetical protein
MAHAVAVENRAGLSSAAFNELAASLRRQPAIKHAIDWLARLGTPHTASDLIAQDEFSHDFLVAYGNELYLSYDSS